MVDLTETLGQFITVAIAFLGLFILTSTLGLIGFIIWVVLIIMFEADRRHKEKMKELKELNKKLSQKKDEKKD